MSEKDDAEAIITAAICYTEVFKKTVLKSMPEPRLTKAQMDFLVALYADGPQKMSGLSKRLSVSREQVTRTAKALKELGFLDIKRGVEDGRNMTPTLTSQGVDYIVRQREISHLVVDEYLNQLPEDDRRTLIECSKTAFEIFKRNGDFPG